MKNKMKIYNDIKKNFKDRTFIEMQKGSVIDLYTLSAADALEDTYKEIDNNRNPHIFTKLKKQELDDTGVMINCPRELNEDDKTYKHRIMNWTLTNEAGNQTAIDDSLLNLHYASSAKYIPFTEGVGTATIYIIPKEYKDDTIEKALIEVQSKVSEKISQSTYVTYVVPTPQIIDIVAYIDSKGYDLNRLQNEIYEQIKYYTNNIPPDEYLNIGEIQKIILLNNSVNYFKVLEIYSDNEIQNLNKLYQPIDKKFLLGELKLINY